MGKTGGFLETGRMEKKIRTVEERIEDFKEIDIHQNDNYVQSQAARCMDCGIPFCHAACPVGNNCPEWEDLVYRGEWEGALNLLQATNPFPEFTGKVCPAPCEGSCTLGLNDKPVTIKNIELAIAEKGWEKGWIVPKIPEKRYDKRVAVIGSGPAGLSAALYLNRYGYDVTVYERDEKAGGLLAFGIPDFKIDKSMIERRVRQMESEGVKFVFGVEAGKDIRVQELEERYDAILLACGSKRPRNLDIEGRDAEGVHFAMDFLTQQNRKNNNIPLYDSEIITTGKHILVIGGGDTGADCVGTSVRQEAASVVQVEIMDRPSETRTYTNPWPQYPLILKTSTSHKEAEYKYGKDPREWNVITKEFIKDENGKLTGVRTRKVESYTDENGRLGFRELEGTEEIMRVDLIFLAIGFVHPYHEGLLNDSRVELDSRGNVAATMSDYKASRDKYFAAGDVRRGQSLVVWAIREGRDAAESVHRYLKDK